MENQSIPQYQVPSTTNLDYVVAEMCNELEDYSPKQRQRLTGLLVSALREMSMLHKSFVETGFYTINDAGILPFPPNAIDVIEIGMQVRGKMHQFTEDNSIITDNRIECGDDEREMQKYVEGGLAPSSYLFTAIWGNVTFQPTYYAMGGGRNNAYYKIDKTARRILFNGNIPKGEVVLVFRSTGVSQYTIIAPEMIKPLKAIAHLERIVYKLDVPANQKQLLDQRKKEAISELRAITQRFSIKQYMDVFYKYKKQTPKA